MPRKVLFVTYHFPPSAASGTHRILGFTQFLPQFGWDAAVVAPPTTPSEPVDERLMESVSDKTAVHYVEYPSGRLHWPLRRVAGKAAWLPFAIRKATAIVRRDRPDVVVTSGPPHCVHRVGRYLKQRLGVSWLADFRDPWISGGSLPRPRSWRNWLARRE